MFFVCDYTLRTILFGSGMLGLLYGSLGTFSYLRRQSLLGDAISHAALPGIVCMFILTHSKSPAVLLIGGCLVGGIGSYLVDYLVRTTKLKKDAALGIVLSVFFGLGLVLLTWVQKHAIAHQAILNKFLFGSAATLVMQEVWLIALVTIAITAVLLLFWKELSLITFDKEYAATLDYPVSRWNTVFTGLLVLAIVVGLQTIGVVLMSSMLIAPAAAARQITHRLKSMVIVSALIGATSCVTGALLSSWWLHVPTGPAITLVSCTVLFGLLLVRRAKN